MLTTVRSPLLAQTDHLEAVAIATLDPLDTLQLWVNEEGPALALRDGHTHTHIHTHARKSTPPPPPTHTHTHTCTQAY